MDGSRAKDEPLEMSVEDIVFPSLPFRAYMYTMEYLLFGRTGYKNVTDATMSISTGVENGDNVVIVNTLHTFSDNSRIENKFTFLRDSFWVVKEVEEISEYIIRTIQNEYFPSEIGQIPLLKSSQINTVARMDGKTTRERSFEITKIIPGAVPLLEFDVARFLPPNTLPNIRTLETCPLE
ncbi:MAG: hypothetical protein ACRC10_07480 [Thermoguttaceae bacterium]